MEFPSFPSWRSCWKVRRRRREAAGATSSTRPRAIASSIGRMPQLTMILSDQRQFRESLIWRFLFINSDRTCKLHSQTYSILTVLGMPPGFFAMLVIATVWIALFWRQLL